MSIDFIMGLKAKAQKKSIPIEVVKSYSIKTEEEAQKTEINPKLNTTVNSKPEKRHLTIVPEMKLNVEALRKQCLEHGIKWRLAIVDSKTGKRRHLKKGEMIQALSHKRAA